MARYPEISKADLHFLRFYNDVVRLYVPMNYILSVNESNGREKLPHYDFDLLLRNNSFERPSLQHNGRAVPFKIADMMLHMLFPEGNEALQCLLTCITGDNLNILVALVDSFKLHDVRAFPDPSQILNLEMD